MNKEDERDSTPFFVPSCPSDKINSDMAFRDAFNQFPVLETARLVLRHLGPEDAENYHRQLHSAYDLPGRPPWDYGVELRSPETVRASFQWSDNAWKKKARLKWGLFLKSGELVGQGELFDFANQSKAEIGFWLGANFHGRGLMTEAVTAIVQHALGSMEMNRVYARTSTQNGPSLAMLKKVGFVQEGVLRSDSFSDGAWDDTALMAIIKSDL